MISSDGRFVVFYSIATNLTSDVVDGDVAQVFVRDRQQGTTRLVSVNAAGTAGNGPSFEPAISADGRYVVFVSFANDLVVKDTNQKYDFFVRDLMTGTTTLVSVNRMGTDSGKGKPTLSDGSPLDPLLHSFWPLMSSDGRRVVFLSYADDLVDGDTNDAQDVFVRDLLTGETRCISVNRAGLPTGNRTPLSSTTFFFFDLQLSANGRYVAFESFNNDLVDNDNNCNGPCDGTNSLNDVFVRDLEQNKTVLVSINRDGTHSSSGFDPVMSADGRFVAFVSVATDLVPNNFTRTQQNVYVRDMTNGVTNIVSINRAGTDIGEPNASHPRISGDGRFVTFQSSSTELAPNKNDVLSQDVFVRDMEKGLTTLVSVNRNGNDNGRPLNRNSFAQYVSVDGRYIVFISNNNDMVRNDNNGGISGGGHDIFVRDLAVGTTTPLSLSLSGFISGEAGLGEGRISMDGRTLVFDDLASDLVANDTNDSWDIFARPAHENYPIDEAKFFVEQHYRDFLNREADAAGLEFWTNQITSCGADAQCVEVKRINVSAAFFLSIEFQQTGYFAYRVHHAAFNTGERLKRRDLLLDTQEVGRGVRIGQFGWELQLQINKRAFAESFLKRPAFLARYPTTMSNAEFVDSLNANTGGALSQSERDSLVGRLNAGQINRAESLWEIAEDADLARAESNRAFVLMQYAGYLRRNPDDAPDNDFAGYNFWLNKLNQFGGNFISSEMVKGFITSGEYRQRFDQ